MREIFKEANRKNGEYDRVDLTDTNSELILESIKREKVMKYMQLKRLKTSSQNDLFLT